jgi:ribonuclease G
LKSKRTITHQIFREIERSARGWREDTVVVNCHPAVAEQLSHAERETLRFLMMKYNKTIQVRPQPNNHQEQYDLHPRWSRREEKTARGQAASGAPPADPAAAATSNGGKS